MKRHIAAILIMIMLVAVLAGCVRKYDENDFIGKSSQEIQEELGDFDCTYGEISEDGLYRNTKCGYTYKEARKGFLGTEEEELFLIRFNEDGIATECTYGPRPGG